MQNEPKRIIVHHTAVASTGRQLPGVNADHKARGFPRSSFGLYVGYHYFIERDGSITACRDVRDEGAHTIGYNLSSIGIGLAGNFDIELPSDAQRASLVAVLRRTMREFNIPVTQIFPHRAFASKSCYGSLLGDKWAAWEYVRSELSIIQKSLAALRLITRI